MCVCVCVLFIHYLLFVKRRAETEAERKKDKARGWTELRAIYNHQPKKLYIYYHY